MPAQWPQGMIPWLDRPKRFAAYLTLSPCFPFIYQKPKGRCLFCAAVEGEEGQAAAARLSLCATHGMGLVCLAAGQLQEGCSPGLEGFPQLQTWWWLCARGPVSPWAETSCCAEMELRAARVGGRRQRGRALHMALPRAFPEGQRCVCWVHVWGPKGCWELLSRAISWQCPCSKDVTVPGRVGEGETHWCNPAGPLALGMGYLGRAGGGKDDTDHA